jgi:hypothetical protein
LAAQSSRQTQGPASFQTAPECLVHSKVVAYHPFEDERRAERELQAMFRSNRVLGREFYEIAVEPVHEALLLLSNGKLADVPSHPSGAAMCQLETKKI